MSVPHMCSLSSEPIWVCDSNETKKKNHVFEIFPLSLDLAKGKNSSHFFSRQSLFVSRTFMTSCVLFLQQKKSFIISTQVYMVCGVHFCTGCWCIKACLGIVNNLILFSLRKKHVYIIKFYQNNSSWPSKKLSTNKICAQENTRKQPHVLEVLQKDCFCVSY